MVDGPDTAEKSLSTLSLTPRVDFIGFFSRRDARRYTYRCVQEAKITLLARICDEMKKEKKKTLSI